VLDEAEPLPGTHPCEGIGKMTPGQYMDWLDDQGLDHHTSRKKILSYRIDVYRNQEFGRPTAAKGAKFINEMNDQWLGEVTEDEVREALLAEPAPWVTSNGEKESE
jgi:hypothetical protein